MRISRRSFATFTTVLMAALIVAAHAQTDAKPDNVSPSIPTPTSVVDEIMKLGGVGPGDYVVDLGSGDGRLVIAAVEKYNARGGFGVEISSMMVTVSNQNAAKAGVADRVQFYERDLFEADLRDATVVTIYLLPSIMGKVEKKLLAELRPGTRVVVHDFPFPSWRPEKVIGVNAADKIEITGLAFTQLYLYKVPRRD
jgi:cyclopropane fatty-acyl-phospholipid synthase-like methyltransferase